MVEVKPCKPDISNSWQACSFHCRCLRLRCFRPVAAEGAEGAEAAVVEAVAEVACPAAAAVPR